MSLPRLCSDLPGVGGRTIEPEDFRVDELPAYTPSGSGEHAYVRIEKRGVTTNEAVRRLARHAEVAQGDVGYAGQKDRHAVTTQWLSLTGADPARLEGYDDGELRVLEVARHGNKLRTGHLRGNRFCITLREVHADALQRARAIVERLASEGLPNFYGAQRFGAAGDNAERAAAALRGEGRLPRDKRQRRLIVSSLQSAIFNDVVRERMQRGALRRVLGGEVLVKRSGSAPFVSDETAVDDARVQRGEIDITGPICGPRMPRPREGSPARELEDAVLAQHGVTPDDFKTFGRLARGGRRAIVVDVEELSVAAAHEGAALELRFALPSGSYATVLIAELSG
ncbi:MAG: tRNA pseudouridine(13) synthase TruD [Myxococcales bacterium]|nr:tRNA pseudouridine(13) synthase TruD [Myxococcales bacterium]